MHTSLPVPLILLINAFKYAIGVFAWLVIIIVLQISCVFNFESFVDSLWMKDINNELSVNLLGEVAFRAPYGYGDFGCGERFIYMVRYHPGKQKADDDTDARAEVRSLGSLVDANTWKFVRQDGIFTYYSDSHYTYRVRHISDGTDISVEPR